MEKILVNNYYSKLIRFLCKSVTINIFLISLDSVLVFVNILDVQKSNENIFRFIHKPYLVSLLFYIILGLTLCFYILYNLSVKLTWKLYNIIFINLLEFLHLRILPTLYFRVIMEFGIPIYIKFLMIIIISILAIKHFLTYHLFYYSPQKITNFFPFDYYSAYFDIILVFIKVVSSLIYFNSSVLNSFLLYSIVCILLAFIIFSFYLMRLKSFYFMNNPTLNKTRIIWLNFILISLAINLFYHTNGKSYYDWKMIVIYVNILFILIGFIWCYYNPYAYINFDKYKKTKDTKMNEEHMINLLFFIFIEFSCNKIRNIEEESKLLLTDVDSILSKIPLTSRNFYSIMYEFLMLLKSQSSIILENNNKNWKKQIKLTAIVQFKLLNLIIKYQKVNQLVSINFFGLYELLFKKKNKVQENYKDIDKRNLDNEGKYSVIFKIQILNKSNEFLLLINKVFDNILQLIEHHTLAKYNQYIEFSELVNQLTDKNFIHFLKEGKNSFNYSQCLSLILYEELFNCSINSDQIQFLDNFQQYKDLLNTQFNNLNEILIHINIEDFSTKLIFSGKLFQNCLNKGFSEIFPSKFKELQESNFINKIKSNNLNAQDLTFHLLIYNENKELEVINLTGELFCINFNIYFFGTYKKEKNIIITFINNFESSSEKLFYVSKEIFPDNDSKYLKSFLESYRIPEKYLKKVEFLKVHDNFSYTFYEIQEKKVDKKFLHSKLLEKVSKNNSNASSADNKDKNLLDNNTSILAYTNRNTEDTFKSILASKKKSEKQSNKLISYKWSYIIISLFLIWIVLYILKVERINLMSLTFFNSYDSFIILAKAYRNYYQLLASITICTSLKMDNESPGINFINEYNQIYNDTNLDKSLNFDFVQMIQNINQYQLEEIHETFSSLASQVYNFNDETVNEVFNTVFDYKSVHLINDSEINITETKVTFSYAIKILLSSFNKVINEKSYIKEPTYMFYMKNYNFALAKNQHNEITEQLLQYYELIINFNSYYNLNFKMQDAMFHKIMNSFSDYTTKEYFYLSLIYAYNLVIMFFAFLQINMYDKAILILINEIRFECFNPNDRIIFGEEEKKDTMNSENDNSINNTNSTNNTKNNNSQVNVVSFNYYYKAKIKILKGISELYSKIPTKSIKDLQKIYEEHEKYLKYSLIQRKKSGNQVDKSEKSDLLKDNLSANNRVLDKILIKNTPLNFYKISLFSFAIICTIEFIIFTILWALHFNDTKKTLKIINNSLGSEFSILGIFNLYQIMIYSNQTEEEFLNWINENEKLSITTSNSLVTLLQINKDINDLDGLITPLSSYFDFGCDEYYTKTNISMFYKLNKNTDIDYFNLLSNYCNNEKIMDYSYDINYIFTYHYSNIIKLFNYYGIEFFRNSKVTKSFSKQYVSTALFHLLLYIPNRLYTNDFIFVDWVNKIKIKINSLFMSDTIAIVLIIGTLLVFCISFYMIMLSIKFKKVVKMRRVFDIEKISN